MRRSLLLVLLAAGCGDANQATERALDAAEAADESRVACAPAGATDFTRDCTLERAAGPDGLTLILRAPDGAFRRLLVTGDGRGVVAADGSEPAIVSVLGDKSIEVRVGADRFRLPATVK